MLYRMLHPKGSVYQGQFSNGKPGGGEGTQLFAASGDSYTGVWVRGYPHGAGKLTKANGSHYVGQFAKGKMEGTGIFTFANGDVHAGEWKGAYDCTPAFDRTKRLLPQCTCATLSAPYVCSQFSRQNCVRVLKVINARV